MLTKKATTLSNEAIAQFQNSLYGKGRSALTVKAYSSDLQALLTDTESSSIPAHDLETVASQWLTHYKRIVAPKTTCRRLTSIRAFGRWIGLGVILEDYTAPIPSRPTPHPLPEGIQGVIRMIEVANNANERAMVALCGLVGLRIAEALDNRPSHFDLQSMELTVRGKGDRTRIVPVSERAWGFMSDAVTRAYVTGSDPLTVGFKDRYARTVINRLGEKARLSRRVASHDLRATFATAVHDKTHNQRLVQELLGHADGRSTEVYIGVNQNELRSAVEL